MRGPIAALVAPAWIGIVAGFVTDSAVVMFSVGFACPFAASFFLTRALASAIFRVERNRLTFWGEIVGFAAIYGFGILATTVPWPL